MVCPGDGGEKTSSKNGKNIQLSFVFWVMCKSNLREFYVIQLTFHNYLPLLEAAWLISKHSSAESLQGLLM